MKVNKSEVKKTHKSIKEFNYALGGMSLNLSVDVDNKKDVADLIQILKGALTEIQEELK